MRSRSDKARSANEQSDRAGRDLVDRMRAKWPDMTVTTKGRTRRLWPRKDAK